MIKDRQIDRDFYRFGYQGQNAEKDEETRWNHFELREYDPTIGRWFQKDPAGQYSSPYVGMGNCPTSGIDPNGGRFLDWYRDDNHGITYQEGVHGEQEGYTWIAGESATYGQALRTEL